MLVTRARQYLTVLAAGVALIAASPGAFADLWLDIDTRGTVEREPSTAATAPQLVMQRSDFSGFSVSMHADGLLAGLRENKAGRFIELNWPGAEPAGEIGGPQVPVIRRLFAVPAGARVVLTVDEGARIQLDTETIGLPVVAWPTQPPIEKVPGARENAPFVFDASQYNVDGALPGIGASVRELGIVRGQRLWELEVYPLAYNPVAETITFWSDLTVHVDFVGGQPSRSDLNPAPGFARTVLNPEIVPQVSTRGSGNYLIVVPSGFASDIASFAAAKTAQGFNVTTYTVPAGTSSSAIRSEIQSYYGGANPPDYVLLVGDTAGSGSSTATTIPHFVGSGDGNPNTDLNYSMMDAGDYYPDLAVGRFPADDSTDLANIIAKTLYYENGPLSDPDYTKRAVFMAGDDNYDITEGTHNYCINNYMNDPTEWLVDKVYEVTYGATTQDTIDSFNDGRFWGVFSGHGGSYSWADGPSLSQAQVEALTNTDMYAYVCSFACITGSYHLDECFMETWVLTPNSGALTSWGSSVNSYWDEDDILQRGLFDIIFDETDPTIVKDVGPVYNLAKMEVLAHYGNTATVRRYFEMYNLMGDPAVPFPGNCPDAGEAQLDSGKYQCEDTLNVTVDDCGLNLDDQVAETVTVDIDSTSETGVETILLTETSPSSASFAGAIDISTIDAAGVLLVTEGDLITLTYIDADDGAGGANVPVTDVATVDCTSPTISNIAAIDVEARDATIIFDSDEPVTGTVHYGTSCGQLNFTASGALSATPAVALTGLLPSTTYYYTVEAADEAGNATADPNCYSFSTAVVPDFFTEQFDGDLDLEGKTLTFTPNGSIHHYAGCAEDVTELPTDPTGGTTVSLGDDDSQQVTIAGDTVALYGTAYSSFYIGSNGYITFGGGDTGYSESTEEHFSMPRISALFDDLNPTSGGAVSYRELADRVAVTWQGVPEYSSTGSNTFQVEMFFDGKITITHLSVTCTDAVVGLSEGSGQDPDFTESDLSALPSCEGPPMAHDSSYTTYDGAPLEIELVATDEGLPDPPSMMHFVITSLPAHGALEDLQGGTITTVPYELLNNGNLVQFHPDPNYEGPDSFEWHADDNGTPPSGGASNTAVCSLTLELTGPPSYGLAVDWQATGQNNGQTWRDAFNHLQDALDAAAADPSITEIWVAAGSYTPDLGAGRTPGDRNATFAIPDGVEIYGGFAGGEMERSQRDYVANVTVLSGDLNGDDAPINAAAFGRCYDPAYLMRPDCEAFDFDDDGYVNDDDLTTYLVDANRLDNSNRVITIASVATAPTLDGLTVSGGYAFDVAGGGGIYLSNAAANLTNCRLIDNIASDRGGALQGDSNAQPLVTACVFENNLAANGGAVDLAGGEGGTYANTTFVANAALHTGGAIRQQLDARANCTDCTFEGNVANEGGGLACVIEGPPLISDCTFTANVARSSGAAIFNDNCIMSPNIAGAISNVLFEENVGRAVVNRNGSRPTTSGCTFVGNIGGAMVNEGTAPGITGCTFIDNEAERGGAIKNVDASPIITLCMFEGNRATYAGGAICSVPGHPRLNRCTFYANRAQYGGAIANESGTGISNITNSMFVGNTATDAGAVIAHAENAGTTMAHCTLAGNGTATAATIACGFDTYTQSGAVTVTNSILDNGGNEISNPAGATIAITWSNVAGGWPGTGNFALIPWFVANPDDGGDGWGDDPATPGVDESLNDDYGDVHLTAVSPCVNAGDPNYNPLPWVTDMDGDQRVLHGCTDVGCDECVAAPVPDCNNNGTPDVSDLDPADPDGDGWVSNDCNGNGVPDECEAETYMMCFTGAEVPADASCDGCDLDLDGDVDLHDFAVYQSDCAAPVAATP